MSNNNTTYGIVGGLGSYAGLDVVKRLNYTITGRALEKKINKAGSGVIEDNDFPEVFYYQIPFAGVSATGKLKGNADKQSIGEMLSKRAPKLNADKVLFACNTYNAFADDHIDNHISLNTAFDEILSSLDGRTLLLASTEKTRQVKQNNKYADKFLYLDTPLQQKLEEIIETTIARGHDYTASAILHRIISEALGKEYEGANNVLIACTEISVYYDTLVWNYESEQDFVNYKVPNVYDTVEQALSTMIGESN